MLWPLDVKSWLIGKDPDAGNAAAAAKSLQLCLTLQPHRQGLQNSCQAPHPPLSPGVCSDSYPLSQWYYLIILSSVSIFSFWVQSFPASESFPASQLFPSSGQSTGTSASASVLPMSIQGWFPLGWTGLICLLSKELSRLLSSITVWKHQFFSIQPSLWSSSDICTSLDKIV